LFVLHIGLSPAALHPNQRQTIRVIDCCSILYFAFMLSESKRFLAERHKLRALHAMKIKHRAFLAEKSHRLLLEKYLIACATAKRSANGPGCDRGCFSHPAAVPPDEEPSARREDRKQEGVQTLVALCTEESETLVGIFTANQCTTSCNVH